MVLVRFKDFLQDICLPEENLSNNLDIQVDVIFQTWHLFYFCRVLYADPVKVKRYLNRMEREGIARVKVSINLKLWLSQGQGQYQAAALTEIGSWSVSSWSFDWDRVKVSITDWDSVKVSNKL